MPSRRISRATVHRGTSIFSLLQLTDFSLQLLDPIALRRCETGSLATVALCSPHPLAQRVRRASDLLCDRTDRSPLRLILPSMLHHQSNGSLANLRRVPAPLSHVRILSSFRASGKAGSIHST